jgi:hypothetical protein
MAKKTPVSMSTKIRDFVLSGKDNDFISAKLGIRKQKIYAVKADMKKKGIISQNATTLKNSDWIKLDKQIIRKSRIPKKTTLNFPQSPTLTLEISFEELKAVIDALSDFRGWAIEGDLTLDDNYYWGLRHLTEAKNRYEEENITTGH